jgi:hypothetical protein
MQTFDEVQVLALWGNDSTDSGTGDPVLLTPRLRFAMLSDADLEEIRQGLRDGLRGPILLKWCQKLLAERDELAARLQTLEDARDDQHQPMQP